MNTSNEEIRRFVPSTGPAILDDLRVRLHATRWPDAPEDTGWSLGADVAYLHELAGYWADEFDWPTIEEKLGSVPRFHTQIAGLDVHFMHVRAAETERPAVPLLLCHGWPDSSWRYSKVIELLTDPGAHGGDPADAFDVIIPDMPGYGYSQAPLHKTLNSVEVSDMWAELMSRLGYKNFATAGGDIGTEVCRYLALDHIERIIGVHRIDGGLPVFTGDKEELTAKERAWFEESETWGQREAAYAQIHITKPQTAAFGLNDSPVGLAAWIVEKMRSWSDCDGDLESVYTKDEILTNVMQYWLTGTIGSSMRMYSANAAIDPAKTSRYVEVPCGYSIFAGDILRPPREWLERTSNLTYLSEPERGGHFAPFEQPERYVKDLREFFGTLRT
ncbi:epoxide hydrolase family protein [Mycobacteroides chelonae]|uniref:epoxide hydrolase family protein n=1 Tax=Mycobacteroides chelonae TaxID=1774 RepID=UPI0005C7324B|nr:epoxide hydrolase family protein [Mycobacteroides chelonae]MBF9318123.1 epoxide hydrolase 1 [Mycobacteroides chelonae]OHT72279.1 multidrug MFS transporter [Mycobacteroides chelonae]OHT75172.1 multidrug MFS transporter [Mycobacteroides chelonae]OHT90111.1 multidrug MFS transporter [Mycobacteroides chelonae]